MHSWLAMRCASVLVAGDGLLDWLRSSHGATSLGVLALLLVLGTVGVPVPEELSLALGGYLAARGAAPLLAVHLVGWLVLLAIDIVLFETGRRLGPRVAASRVGRRLGEARLARAEAWFARRGVWTVAIARFVMGSRTPTFLLAGAFGMSWRRFLPTVALAGLAYTAILVLLGWHLADGIDRLLAGLSTARGLVLAVLAGTLGAALLVLLWRRRRRRIA